MTAFRDWLGDPGDWVDRALCREVDPVIFHPEKGGSAREAISVCKACDVIEECLTWALDIREVHGILGGKSGKERRKILHDRGVQLSADLGGVA